MKLFTETKKINGFTVQEGFVALLDEKENPVAITSGWENNGEYFVYRQSPTGEWVGEWESEPDFPAAEVGELIAEYHRSEDIKKALAFAEGKKLKVSNEKLTFTEVVAGDKCNNGGEYGFWTEYRPIAEYPGLYEVYSRSSCDFDSCGTGYEGIKALTVSEYRRLRRESDEVEEAGSLY